MRQTTNTVEYGDHHFQCFQRAEGWWGEVFKGGQSVATMTASGHGLKRTHDEAAEACRADIDTLNVEVRWMHFRHAENTAAARYQNMRLFVEHNGTAFYWDVTQADEHRPVATGTAATMAEAM